MSSARPPLPALIPIAVLRKSPLSNNNIDTVDENHRDCVPCINRKVIEDQRSQRTAAESPEPLIDNSRSRDASAAPQSRKIRPERHRKSNRQRDRHRRAKTRSESKKPNDDQPINPRVNPIFVWVRQEDTRIVEVKCEDYDKRNRILLTKTPQGWRATPRTETLIPSQKEEDDRKHQHHHRSKKSKRNKVKQKSTAVQVEELTYDEEEPPDKIDTPKEFHSNWESPVNVETLLPSHTIHVQRKDSCSSEQSCPLTPNSAVHESAQIGFKCSGEKISDNSPLDSLLAVAELEFNEQLQSGQWDDPTLRTDDKINQNDPMENLELNDEQKDLIEDMEQLQSLIESCTQNDEHKFTPEDETITTQKEDCDYTEDEENNLAMNDILSRLEQSLRSPEGTELESTHERPETERLEFNEDHCDNSAADVPNVNSTECLDIADSEECDKTLDDAVNDDSKQEEPTDLSLKSMRDLTIEIPPRTDYFEQPTDLSIPKQNKLNQRPPSQSSESLQSPQPSGLPAILPSPNIISPGIATNTSSSSKDKAAFPESSSQTPTKTSGLEVLNEGQKKPLDLGKSRKSASPTVTCSEEVNNRATEDEPPTKKLKTSVQATQETADEYKKSEDVSQSTQRSAATENQESDTTPINQLHKLLLDETLNVPDPILVPKKSLRKIIANPGVEIPELLKKRPELRLPEALEFPHLLQDPDILVITIQQLEEIVKQQSPTKVKSNENTTEKISSKVDDCLGRKETKQTEGIRMNFLESLGKNGNELGDIDLASNAALNHLFWLPYVNQLEALQLSRNPDLMMALANSNMRTMQSMPPNLSHLMTNNGFPPSTGNFRLPPYNNPFEMNLWQGPLLQSGMLGQKNPNSFETRNFKDFMGRLNYEDMNRKYMHNQKYSMENKYAMHNQFLQPSTSLSNPYVNQSQSCHTNVKSRMPASRSSSNVHKNTNSQTSKPTNSHRHHTVQGMIRMKPAHKLMNNVKMPQKTEIHHSRDRKTSVGQPIDLSGATSTVGGYTEAVKHRQLIDSLHHLKHSRNDDVGEVGSTTASIEEMQEAHKHLWHPLFGTDKSHNNTWNLTPSMAASSE